jgi:uncharacterized membrane protein
VTEPNAVPEPVTLRWPRVAAALLALAVVVIVFFAQLPPTTVLGKADFVGYSICHRIPARSFILNGRQLPLCARCTGTFLGVVFGVVATLLLRRQRASRLPPPPVLMVLILFTALWGFDGLNSYLTLFPAAPNLYEPQNWLRMTTGMLNGLALVIIVLPIYRFTMWRDTTEERVLKSLWELLAILPLAALLIWLTAAEIDLLLYPLAVLSSLGVLIMLVLINSMIVTIVIGREGYAESWLQAALPLTIGTALAILQLSAMALLRLYITVRFGLPF